MDELQITSIGRDVLKYLNPTSVFCHYSSVSSMLNSLAAVTWEDFLKLKFSALSERSATKVTRTLGKIDKV